MFFGTELKANYFAVPRAGHRAWLDFREPLLTCAVGSMKTMSERCRYCVERGYRVFPKTRPPIKKAPCLLFGFYFPNKRPAFYLVHKVEH